MQSQASDEGPLSALLARLQNDRNALGLLFLLPTAALLLLFLTYPLGLGTWLGFTDTKIGRGGEWIGLENYEFLWGDEVTRLALFNTLFYTVVASVIKFGLGLWLALLLNRHLPFKAFLRAIVLLPFIVPTALSAIAFWWIYDSQFSIISWTLERMGLIHGYIDFLGNPWNARFSTIAANIGRGVRDRDGSISIGCNPVLVLRPSTQGLAAGRERQMTTPTLAASPLRCPHRGSNSCLGAARRHE